MTLERPGSLDMPGYISKSLAHQTVHIRIGASEGAGKRYYAKFELEGLDEAIATEGGELCR